jgi:hypothetical protein
MKLSQLSIFLIAIASSHCAAVEDSRLRVEISDHKLRSSLLSLMDAVQARDGVKVWSLGDASWKQLLLRERGSDNLNDFRSDIWKADKIVVDYADISRLPGKGKAFFSVYVVAGGGGSHSSTYRCFIVFKENPDGWHFLNLPFRDFIIPFEAALMTACAHADVRLAK